MNSEGQILGANDISPITARYRTSLGSIQSKYFDM